MKIRFLENIRLTIKEGNRETLCRYEAGDEIDLSEEICKQLAEKKVRFYPVRGEGAPIHNRFQE